MNIQLAKPLNAPDGANLKMRVFIKYISADSEHTVHYFTCKLDKQKHKMQKDSFMVEILDKVARSLNSPVVNPSEKLVWLAPNH